MTSRKVGCLMGLALSWVASACAGDADGAGAGAGAAGLVSDGVEQPRPVVLVAGLMQDENTVAPLAEALRDEGLDVTLWVPGNSGFDDINMYAEQLGATVEQVLARTGAAQVDLVGHSEGGLTARTYANRSGGDTIHTLIALGSPQQGTEGGLLSLLLLVAGCETWATACKQMIAGSPFLSELNGEDPTPGDVQYFTVATRHDGVVQPVTRASIPDAKNIVMQDSCRLRTVGHFGLLEDAWVHDVVLDILSGREPKANCRARPVGGLL